MFEEFYNKQRKLEPTEPKYISICKVIQGSGADREEVEFIFNSIMVIGEDYDAPEFKEMVDYLVEISKDLDD